MPSSLEAAILGAVRARPGGSVCPSEVARALWPEAWRGRMDEVRAAAWALAAQGRLRVTQGGRDVGPDARGPVRLATVPEADGEAVPVPDGFAERFARERRPPCQLYLISPERPGPDFPDALAAALAGGPVAAFQLRLKGADDAAVLTMAAAIRPLLAERGVDLIINDRADLAAAAGADGVHLGQADGTVAAARALLGRAAQIGVTCHASRHLAMEAAEAGADYVAFGAFHPSATKPSQHRPDPALLSWWTTISPVPCVAIGGITPANAAPLVAAGADFLAVSAAVWAHPSGPAAGVAAFASPLTGRA